MDYPSLLSALHPYFELIVMKGVVWLLVGLGTFADVVLIVWGVALLLIVVGGVVWGCGVVWRWVRAAFREVQIWMLERWPVSRR